MISKPQAAHILIADDEFAVCNVVRRCLETEGHQCDVAHDGREALRKLSESRYDLLITDIMMPNLSGMSLLAEVRKAHPTLGVIILTALDDRQIAMPALRMGAYGYMIKPFDQNELLINVAGALERTRLMRLKEQYEQELEERVRERTSRIREREAEITVRLAYAAEHRDLETGAHIRRIGLFAGLLAEARGWSPEAVEDIRLAAPMHDIGKIGVPDHILLKPGKLTPEEFDLVKRHAEIGAKILEGSNVPLVRMARDIALYHHERWDGTGYPHALAGEAIPEAARIVGIVDVYDALTSPRIYRAAFSEDVAVATMREERGKHFEPALLDCFLELLPDLRAAREKVGHTP